MFNTNTTIMINFKKYDVHYIDNKNKQKVYRSNWSLCIDGAEEAARMDLKGSLKEIVSVEAL